MRTLRLTAADRATRPGGRFALGTTAWVGVVALLALSVNDACAAALGSFATSVGLFATLAALSAFKGWPVHLPASALSTAGGALVVAGGAAWWWRARATGRLSGFAAAPGPIGGDVLRWRANTARSAAIALPAGVDREQLLADLRRLFVQLQEAWDCGEMHALGLLTTREMLAELCLELPGRSICGDDEGRSTEVVTLHAELLGFEAMAGAFVVSVEFSGLIRECADRGAAPFRELWMLTRSNGSASGWRLARHQALL
jgi:predicted lipid-binding transport protein (Tim44 family)